MTLIDAFHKQRTGRDVENPPKRFTDKIAYRKKYGRGDFLTYLADKLKCRAILGDHALPLIHAGEDYTPTSYPFVAKPNHWSGHVQIIKNRDGWIEYKKLWDRLSIKTYGVEKGEWAYQGVTPRLLIEPVITGFWDMKCYVFHGKVGCFYVCGKGNGRPEKNGVSYFTPDGEFIEVTHNGKPNPFREVPFDFTRALEVAKSVTPDIDFVRTDLMVTPDKVYVSEFTLYPGSGCIRFDPDSFDLELGGLWKLR